MAPTAEGTGAVEAAAAPTTLPNVRARKPAADVPPGASGKSSPPTDVGKAKKAQTSPRSWQRVCVSVLRMLGLLLLLSLPLAGFIGYNVVTSPKPLEDQWDDVVSYAKWRWHLLSGSESPCTYAGVKHYSWGAAVDAPRECACWLRRCPPAPDAANAVRVYTRQSKPPVVRDLLEQCRAAGFPAADTIKPEYLARFLQYPDGAVSTGGHLYTATPTCVQAGRLYAHKPPLPNEGTPDPLSPSPFGITVSVGDHVEPLYNLTDRKLREASKYHPVTVVPAMGVLFSTRMQTGNLYHMVKDGFNGFTMIQQDATDFTDDERELFARTPRQVLFLSHPSLDWDKESPTTSLASRDFANAASRRRGGASGGAQPKSEPFFTIPPISRTRVGEGVREPMYCFCQAVQVPSSAPMKQTESDAVTFPRTQALMNEYFNEAPFESTLPTAALLAEDAADDVVREQRAQQRRQELAELDVIRARLHPDIAAKLWGTRVHRSTPSSASSTTVYRPRLLWVRRADRRVADDGAYMALAEKIGFDVQPIQPEEGSLSAAEQYHAGRYADVITGMHGMAFVHAAWMDHSVRRGCRSLLELLPYAQVKQLTHFYSDYTTGAGGHYDYVAPIDVTFGPSVGSSPAAVEREKGQLMGKAFSVYGLAGFNDQTAIFDPVTVEQKLQETYDRVMSCLLT